MKNINYIDLKYFAVILMIVATMGCERELSDDAVLATFPNTAEVFTDSPIGLGTDFYFPFAGSKPTAWTVDESEGFESDATMRIDVPNTFDPEGGYAGGILRIDGVGRDLTEYDALTFYAKASRGAFIDALGFGTDFLGDRFQTSITNLSVTTNWVKYVIPIPDPSKLTEERGMFWYSTASKNSQGLSFTFWVDELKFERLGSIGQSVPMINGGLETTLNSFEGGTGQVNGFSITQNVDGDNINVSTTSAYFDFQSSNPEVATVDETGFISVVGQGEAQITASVAGVLAQGAINVIGGEPFQTAPVPTRPAADVISIFSDVYNNEPASVISNFGGQSSTLSAFQVGDDNILNYQNVNFLGIEFNSNVDFPTINGSRLTTLHLDVFVPGSIASGAFLNVAIRDAGSNDMVETDVFTGQPIGDDSQVDVNAPIVQDQWVSVDLDMTALSARSNLAQIVLFSPDQGPNEFYVDNIYFY